MRASVSSIILITIAITGLSLGQDGMTEVEQELWAIKRRDGVLTEEEYQHVLKTGHLPSSVGPLQSERVVPRVHAQQREFLKMTKGVRYAHFQLRHRERLLENASERTQKHAADMERLKQMGLPEFPILLDGERGAFQGFENGLPVYLYPANRIAGETISTDHIQSSATSNDLGLAGSGVVIGLLDGGLVRTTHQEFAGNRIVQKELNLLGSTHATAVAGTLAASGVETAALGMAPTSTVFVYSTIYSVSKWIDAVAETNIYVSVISAENDPGWHHGSSGWSWGGVLSETTNEHWLFGYYGVVSHEIDLAVGEAIFSLPVLACGNSRDQAPSEQPVNHFVYFSYDPFDYGYTNMYHPPDGQPDGYDSLGGYWQASKNPLVVGAVLAIADGYTSAEDVVLTSYSSVGPTDDGRIKPDVVADGRYLYTTGYWGGDTSYVTAEGTSMAAPCVGGSIALLVELHERYAGPSAPLLASTLKGLVIHTADEAGDSPGPDYRFGWGLMNTLSASRLITEDAAWNSRPHIKEVILQDGDHINFVVHAVTNEALKVTICWTDAPGAPQPWELDPTNIVLVNDLDLRVISPNGTTNMPWVLDGGCPSNAATTGDNMRDNVEQVYIASPTNGDYTVVVSHKGSLSNGLQDVSILISGNVTTNVDFKIEDFVVAATSGSQNVSWSSVVGSIYRPVSSTNLTASNAWVVCGDDISATKELMSWTDNCCTGTVDGVRFYRILNVE